MNNTLTALPGVKVGHATHLDKLTGCTLVMFDHDLPVGYVSNGGAPGTFNTELLRNGKSYNRHFGLFIAGGSLNGLASSASIMRKMIENKIGFKESVKMINPSISGAIVFDLGTDIDQYNPEYGAEAFDNLSLAPVQRGNVGAGTGTAVGKFSYTKDLKMLGMKAGVGCSRIDLGNGVIVVVMSIVNALGNVVKDGNIVAGNRNDTGDLKYRTFDGSCKFLTGSSMNTTISIVGTNVDLKTRENYEKLSQLASQGQIRALSPANTSVDGDTVFVFSTEEIKSFLNPIGKSIEKSSWYKIGIDILGHTASSAVQESIYDACEQSESVEFPYAYKGIIPSLKDY